MREFVQVNNDDDRIQEDIREKERARASARTNVENENIIHSIIHIVYTRICIYYNMDTLLLAITKQKPRRDLQKE